tara:strand:- start:10716 stop:11582 length:867 start_codon:yes stop_codon:yes gene_type:complete
MPAAQFDFLQRNQLPKSYLEQARKNYAPILEHFAEQHHKGHSKTHIIAINGSQGSGKSTLADYLCTVISEQHNITTLALSLDDFYLTKAERLKLAQDVHPLLATRGVPGTHDIELAIATINCLIAAQSPTLVTRFDKSSDDRLPAQYCQTVSGPVGLIVLEGWCMGARPQQQAELCAPVNALEDIEDPKGTWRHYVNNALAGDYQRLFSLADTLCMLRAPSFDTVYKWRLEQEKKMTKPFMSETEILGFIQHYQRITDHCLQEMPNRVDYLFQLDTNRQINAPAQRSH